jgi:fatty acid desaturase (delta-4 desaturase)
MPPNADISRLRNRFNNPIDDAIDDDTNTDEATFPVKSIKQLKGNEIAIEGVVYDLNGFVHPGGDSIKIFGGNEVTAQYKMMHPHHTSRNLEKMKKIGRVSDYKSEYVFDSEFSREMKKEVFKIVRRGREFGTPGYFFRAIFYIGLLAFLQFTWVTKGSSIPLAIILGVSQAWIGLNVQHDANHGAASRRSWINDLLGFGADFIGGDKWTWMEQHHTHHAYCNHNEKDPDSFSAEPFILFNSYPEGHPLRKAYHKLQGLYFLPMLGAYWLSSVFNPQIVDLRQRGALGVGIVMENDWIKSRRKYAIALRLFYIYCNIIAPLQFHDPLTALSHTLLMGFTSSWCLAVLFSLSHNFENSDRDPTESYRKTGKQVCWYKAQVETSSTYGGRVAGYLTGGLNFQIEHHLFPRMSSAWYPYIAPTVRRVCEKHGVRYSYYPTVLSNLISTIKYMHGAGWGTNIVNNPFTGDN